MFEGGYPPSILKYFGGPGGQSPPVLSPQHPPLLAGPLAPYNLDRAALGSCPGGAGGPAPAPSTPSGPSAQAQGEYPSLRLGFPLLHPLDDGAFGPWWEPPVPTPSRYISPRLRRSEAEPRAVADVGRGHPRGAGPWA